MLELLAGLFVALAALALILEPLARPSTPAERSAAGDDPFADPRESESPKVRALVALREIEFDRATGKLSEEDYVRLKAKYEAAAIAAIEAEEAGEVAVIPRAVSAAAPAAPTTPAAAACPRCGPRPEAVPIFCSSCGRSLVGGAQLAGV